MVWYSSEIISRPELQKGKESILKKLGGQDPAEREGTWMEPMHRIPNTSKARNRLVEQG